MDTYTYNRACPCLRCRSKGLMGAAVLITLGVLFLVQEIWYFPFGRSFPVLLIVIGLVMYLSRSAPTEGHIEPYPPQPPLGPPPPPPAINPPGSPGSEVNR